MRKEIPNQPCHEGAPTLKEETVVVSDRGGLRNVLVSIEGIGPAAPFAGETPVLDQVHCRYVPHVLGVTVGQEMIIRSSDDTIHNVHVLADANPPMNFAQTSAGQEKRVTFNKPEILRSKCDVHPWMSAYIAVMENPFFAVSGDDGEFEIKNVPAGSYKVVAWHEQFGKIEQPLIVTDEKPADVSVTYRNGQ
jgi:plastocyanin